MLAFPWTINKSKDSDPVCLPSSELPRARQAGSIATVRSYFVRERAELAARVSHRGPPVAWV